MAETIEKLDPNFRSQTLQGGFVYQDLYQLKEVRVSGLFEGTFCRMDPEALSGIPSEGLQQLAWNTAGATVRFRVPGGRFAVRMELRFGGDLPHMPRTGLGGLDVYCKAGLDRTFHACFRPEVYGSRKVEGEVNLPAGEEEVLLHLPLYDGVSRLELGFPEGFVPFAPTPRRVERPVVFYGSSITQGGCASRPGNCYTAMISRMLDCNTWNLGFSGNAKGEPEMAEYLSAMDMSAFVCDYDHNAPSAEYLEQTHLPLLRTILTRQPDLPVVLVTKPDFFHGDIEENHRRRDIIFRSYLWARERGYQAELVDGSSLFSGPMALDCTVDGCHPNDLGFYRMAQGIAPALERVLN